MAHWSWTEDDLDFADEMLGEKPAAVHPSIVSPSVNVKVSQADAIKIVGQGNVDRYSVTPPYFVEGGECRK